MKNHCGNCSCDQHKSEKKVSSYKVQYKLNYSKTELSRDEIKDKLLNTDAIDQFELSKEGFVIYFDDKLISPEEIENIFI